MDFEIAKLCGNSSSSLHPTVDDHRQELS